MKLDSTAFLAGNDLIEALSRLGSKVECDGDVVLFEQGESPSGLYVLHTGEVVLTMKTHEGEEALNANATTGALLGLPGVVGNLPYSLTAVAKKGSNVSFVEREKFSQLMLKEPNLAMQVLQVLAAEVRAARNILKEQ